jgi:AraC-like DNA-binding protein
LHASEICCAAFDFTADFCYFHRGENEIVRATGDFMRSFTFSSEDLPDGFDDRARIAAWQDFLAAAYAPHQISGLDGQPFSQRLRGRRFDDNPVPVDALRFFGNVSRMSWTTRGQSTPRATHFVLLFNRLPTPLSLQQLGREAKLDTETVVIASCTDPGELCCADPHDFSAIAIDQARLRELVDRAEDLVARSLPSNPAMRHLRRYLEILPTRQEAEHEPELFAHVARTLTDLVALALGAGRDAAELAKTRGLRAARQHEIIREIRARFTDPEISAHEIARQMGVTDRYVQDLLYECGSSFSERVLELRLQRARAMLEDVQYDRLNIAEIANASGFNTIPYFNRSFRRRFGTTPTQFRGRQSSR